MKTQILVGSHGSHEHAVVVKIGENGLMLEDLLQASLRKFSKPMDELAADMVDHDTLIVRPLDYGEETVEVEVEVSNGYCDCNLNGKPANFYGFLQKLNTATGFESRRWNLKKVVS